MSFSHATSNSPRLQLRTLVAELQYAQLPPRLPTPLGRDQGRPATTRSPAYQSISSTYEPTRAQRDAPSLLTTFVVKAIVLSA